MRIRLRGARSAALLSAALLLVPISAAGVSLAGLEIGDPVICDSTWDGGGDGSSFADGANWSENALPGPTASVCLGSSTVVVTTAVGLGSVHGGQITLAAGALDLAGNSEIASLAVTGGELRVHDSLTMDVRVEQSGGTVTGPGSIYVRGPWTWSGGVRSGTGVDYSYRLDLPAGGARSIVSREVTATDIVFGADGAVRLTDPEARLTALGALDAGGHKAEILGSGHVEAGDLRVPTGGSLDLEPAFDTSAEETVSVAAGGVLHLAAAGTQSGTFTLAGDGQLVINADQDFDESSTVTASADSLVSVFGGVTTFAGTTHLGQVLNLADIYVNADASAADVSTTGRIVVQGNTTFDVSGAAGYVQGDVATDPDSDSGDSEDPDLIRTTVLGTLVVRGSGQFHLTDGVLTGGGTIAGPVLNTGGSVEPMGVLRIAGAYTQSGNGGLTITRRDLVWDRLAVEGTATLGGGLALPDAGIVPVTNVDVVTSSNLVGTFGLVLGELLNCGSVEYTATAATLVPSACAAVTDATAAENGVTIEFPVYLTKASDTPIEIGWSTVDGSAAHGQDFAGGSGTVTIAPGQTEATVSIALVDDTTHEDDETFTVNLTAVGANLSSATALGTITDDDEAPLRLEIRDIIADVNSVSAIGIGSAHVVGFETPDADTISSFGWRIEDGAFAYQHTIPYIQGINADDDVIGDCVKVGGGVAPCFRSKQVTTWLKPPATGSGLITSAVNRHDVIVGATDHRALRWSSPTADPAPIGPNDPDTRATALSDSGFVAGTSTYGTGADSYTLAWVMDHNDNVTMIGPLTEHPQFRYLSVTAVGEDGVVYGSAHDGSVRDSTHITNWKWSPAGGLIELGNTTSFNDTNGVGQTVGSVDGVPTLVRTDGKTVDLRQALTPGQDWNLLAVSHINDQGVMVGFAVRPGSSLGHLVALVPPGAGCAVCVDVTAAEPAFPSQTETVPVEVATVDGNDVTLTAVVRNETLEPRTVEVTFLDQDGAPLAEAKRLTVSPKTSALSLHAPWDTEGLAWDAAGKPAPSRVVSVQLRDMAGGETRFYEKSIRVDPKPVITVHGMMSTAATWSAYPQFLHQVNPNWDTFAVDTMDTMPWIPNTIEVNAARMAGFVRDRQIERNAWHVDVVAHSLGGLVSRYYIQNYMPADAQGAAVVDRLIMLGTPNSGSPCADLFDIPLTKELRQDKVARFNEKVTDHKGVPFAEAVGIHAPVTCQTLRTGDDVVPADTAATGVADTLLYELAHTDMTGSAELFRNFVLPRLNGTSAPKNAAPVARLASAAVASPQLLQVDPMTLAAGTTNDISLNVPVAATSAGVAIAAAPSVAVTVLRNGTAIASLPAGGTNVVRSVAFPAPVGGAYTLRFENTGGASVQTEASSWANGLPVQVVGHAEQIGGNGDTASLRITATLQGEIPAGQTVASGTLNLPNGSTATLDLFDDGNHGDGAAGDHTFGTLVANLHSGAYAVSMFLVTPKLTIATTASADIAFVEDLPGDQAPVVRPSTVVTSRDRSVNVNLLALDPEGAAVHYELLTQPQHGSLGGQLPQLAYQPAAGYLGSDSFTWRASDGAQWSAPATVSITVGRAETQLVYEAPFPAQGTTGSSIEARVRLEGPQVEQIGNVPVTFRLNGHTVTSTTFNGRAVATLPLDAPAGQYDLVMSFAGTDMWAPTTLTQKITVIGGAAPRPSMSDGATGEAGYPMRLRVSANDPDGDAARFQIDYTNDGSWDAESGPLLPSGVAWFDHTYPGAVDGQVRVRVTDGAGNAAEHVEALHVAAHRPLGALSLVQAGGAPVESVALSDDGKQALVRVVDTDGQVQLPTPYRLLDLNSGASRLASIAADGSQVDSPLAGAVSTDGRFVAFATSETIGGQFVAQAYRRDMTTGTTVRISVRPDGQPAVGNTYPVDVSTDGRYVLVLSTATGYTTDNVNLCQGNCLEAYLLDTQNHTATLVSRGSDGRPAVQTSGSAAMTPDAKDVVATVRNRVVTLSGTALPLAGTGDLPDVTGAVSGLDLSDNGRFVLFSTAAHLGSDTSDDADLYRFDRSTGARELVSVNRGGSSSDGAAMEAVLDGSGTRVAFSSTATDLVAGAGPVKMVYLRDLTRATTTVVSREARDGTTADHDSLQPLIAGQSLLFWSEADNLVPGDIDGWRDTFRLQLDPAMPPANPVTVTLSAPATVAEGGQLDLTATAAGGRGTFTYTWTTDTGAISGTGGAVRLTAGDGPVDAHLTVTVSDGTATATATAVIKVLNVAPTVNAGPDVAATVGNAVTLHATVGDASSVDAAAGLNPRWVFSDGTTATGVDVTRSWTKPGPVTATVTVTDKDGASTSDSVVVTVTSTTKKASTIKLVASSGAFGFASVKAVVTDPVAGRSVVFTVDGRSQPPVLTDAAGTAVLPATSLPPGSHSVTATVGEDAAYKGATAKEVCVSVSNSSGKVTGTISVAEGTASLDVNANGKEVKGSLTWTTTTAGPMTASLTGLGVSADRKSAWITGKSGSHTVLVYVEDSGEPGTKDVFRLWVDGQLMTATGARTAGNLQIHK